MTVTQDSVVSSNATHDVERVSPFPIDDPKAFASLVEPWNLLTAADEPIYYELIGIRHPHPSLTLFQEGE